LLRHYHYKWQLLSHFREPRARMPCVLIDTAPWSGNVTIPAFAQPTAVFDHHVFKGRRGKWKDLIADIREEMGALASILYEYLFVCGITVPRWLATIMAYAIAVETQDLSVHVTDLDLKAYHDLMLRANTKALGKIRHAPLPRMYYAMLQEAMQNAQAYGRVAWSHLNAVAQRKSCRKSPICCCGRSGSPGRSARPGNRMRC
jgi:nanoRNase/pAp phosphatase (c-di-AMP/oligoRNAs hydrolase)